MSTAKNKSKFTLQKFKRLHATECNGGKFYGTSKLHELPTFGVVDQSSLRPIIANTGTSSHSLGSGPMSRRQIDF